MKAAYIHKPGPADSIVYGDLPDPKPQATEVLVRVKAVAVNPVDTYIRGGAIQMPLPTPFIVGCDLAGVVEAVGVEVQRFKVGDRVWGSKQGLLGRQGVFAELAAVDESWLYPIPSGVSDEQAAAVALAFLAGFVPASFRYVSIVAKLVPLAVVAIQAALKAG